MLLIGFYTSQLIVVNVKGCQLNAECSQSRIINIVSRDKLGITYRFLTTRIVSKMYDQTSASYVC